MTEQKYEHKVHPRAKNLKLRVLPNGTVQVTTPRWTPRWHMDRFVASHADWITAQLAKLPKTTAPATVPQTVTLFGTAYTFHITYDAQERIGVYIKDTSMYINPTNPDLVDGTWHPELQKQLDRFLKATARHYIFPRTEQLAKKMQLEYGRVTLKEQSSRWGSCSSKGNLNFNWRLVHSPPEVIDYVLIHELSHLQEMNHSQAFWNLVERYDPAYKLHRGWLKRHSGSMVPC